MDEGEAQDANVRATPGVEPARRARPWWLLLLLPLVLSAATRGLWAPDEPRYAEIAREIAEGPDRDGPLAGDWVVMHLCGDLYPDKPPLLYWLAALLGRISGWSVLAMRLVSLAATLVSAWLVARLARRWWGAREAALAPAIFLTMGEVAWHGARLQIDPLLAAAVLAAIASLDRLLAAPEMPARRRALWLACLATGLGALAKGPIALACVGLPVLAWLALVPRTAGAHRPALGRSLATALAFAALALAPVLAWALLAIAREPSLRDALLFGQHLGRVTSAEPPHAGPFWQHLAEMPLWLLPWTPAVVLGLGRGLRALGAARRGRDHDVGLLRCLAWFGALFLFFSVVPSKRDLYLLPAYPAAALAAARVIASSTRLSGWIRYPPAVLLQFLGPVLAFAALGLATLIPEALEPASAALLALPALVCMGGALLLFFGWRADASRWTAAAATIFAGLHVLVAVMVFPVLDEAKSARAVAEALAARPEKPSRIPCYGVQPEGYRFYSGVPTVRGGTDPVDVALAREGESFLALCEGDDWNGLGSELRARLVILERDVPQPEEHPDHENSSAVLIVGRAR